MNTLLKTYSELGVGFHVESILLFHILRVAEHENSHTKHESEDHTTNNSTDRTTIQALTTLRWTAVLEDDSGAGRVTKLV